MGVRWPRIIFLPGLACDHRLIEPQRALAAEVVVPPWLEPRSLHEPLAAYAERFARHIAQTVPLDGTYFLAGISFGGMVATELARHLRPRGLMLLSSATSNRGVPGVARLAGETLLPYVPLPLIKPLKNLPMQVRDWAGAAGNPHWHLVEAMLCDASPALLRWSMHALLGWRGHDQPLPPMIHIKGDRDQVLPVSLCRPTHVVRGAGHLMNMTHAAEVNVLLDGFLRAHA
jgi:pimeloyl-ACP methyl ester carboxylesterase